MDVNDDLEGSHRVDVSSKLRHDHDNIGSTNDEAEKLNEYEISPNLMNG